MEPWEKTNGWFVSDAQKKFDGKGTHSCLCSGEVENSL